MKLLPIIAAVGAALSINAQAATIAGAGLSPCGSLVAAYDRDPQVQSNVTFWFSGYLSGLNVTLVMSGGPDVIESVDLQKMFDVSLAICRQNPQAPYVTVLDNLFWSAAQQLVEPAQPQSGPAEPPTPKFDDRPAAGSI
jgi:hypothetical protein